jgi:hypothetical protein
MTHRFPSSIPAAGLVLAAALLVAVTVPAFAAPEDALMPLEKYTTAKAKNLASAHRSQLL